jgi:uncharacterized repeat protein (TIGR03806 family)
MRIIGLLLVCLMWCGPLPAQIEPASRSEGASASHSFDITKRVAWTTSRVIGSPDPPPPYRVSKVFEKLKIDQPITVEHEPGTKNLLLVHQDIPWVGKGRILRLAEETDRSELHVLLDTDRTIYSLAFHPDYARNGYLYVGSNGPVTAEDKNIPGRRFRPGAKKTSTITRYTISREPPFAVAAQSEHVIIEWPSNGHNGAGIAFGKDGMLYVSTGDGTSDSDVDLAGQDLTRLLAKVLRIDVDHPDQDRPYSVPNDNPFVGVAGARPETWAYGFRNPWRLHIDRGNGDMWVGQNGQDLWEQIYLVQRGANYGWSLFEGSRPFQPDRKQGPTPISRPIAEHHHSEARSLTGGVVYYGRRLPELYGAYIYGDWSTGKIWAIRHREGKIIWHRELADTALQVVGFGTDSRGELLIVDYGGGLYRLEKSPEDQQPNKEFPQRLSDTGLFESAKDHEMHPALIPYTVNAALWSDGAHKDRWIALPDETRIEFTEKGGWNFPDGAVLVKTFSLDQQAGEPTSRRRIETRLLTKQQGEWQGYSYVWNEQQTDATLVGSAGADLELVIGDSEAPGGKRVQTWRLPSRAECMVCHSRAANFVLGLNVLQMNKVHDYGSAQENQLQVLQQLGLFSVAAELHEAAGTKHTEQLNSVLPQSPLEYPHLVDPDDDRQELNARARSYLHANCAQCHVVAGGGNSQINLDFATNLADTKLIDVLPQHKNFAKPDTLLVKPGDPENSILYQRIIRRGPGQMPPLATSLVDRRAAKLLHEWISSLPASETAPPNNSPNP